MKQGPPYSATAIANHFLSMATAAGRPLTQMQLQKLVYIAHGWHLALSDNQPLIDERVQAWKFGPVIPSLYQAFRDHGLEPIRTPACDFIWRDDPPGWETVVPAISNADKQTMQLLSRIWNVYGNFSGVQLSKMTHAPGTPWRETTQRYEGMMPRHTLIDNDLIRKHYCDLAKKAEPQ